MKTHRRFYRRSEPPTYQCKCLTLLLQSSPCDLCRLIPPHFTCYCEQTSLSTDTPKPVTSVSGVQVEATTTDLHANVVEGAKLRQDGCTGKTILITYKTVGAHTVQYICLISHVVACLGDR